MIKVIVLLQPVPWGLVSGYETFENEAVAFCTLQIVLHDSTQETHGRDL